MIIGSGPGPKDSPLPHPQTTGSSTVDAERDRVRSLWALGVLDQPVDDRFDKITRIAAQLFDVPMVSLTLIDATRQWRASWVGPLRQQEELSGALCAVAMRSTQTFVRTDLSADPTFVENPFVVGDPGLRFYAGEALHAPDGKPIGTLCVMDTRPRVVSAGQISALADLGRWAERELSRATEHQQVIQVQRRLLPRRAPELPGYAFAGLYAPARGAVGSDFYDWHLVPGGAQFALADVLGSGLGAALVAATVRAALRSTAMTADPAEHLNATSRLLRDDLTELDIDVAVFLGRIEAVTGHLTYVDVGTSLTVLVHADGSHDRLGSDGPPLGGADPRCRTRTAELQPGDTLVCCSPSLRESRLDPMSPDRVMGPGDVVDALAAAVAGASRLADIEQCIAALELSHEGPEDLTAVVVRRLATEAAGVDMINSISRSAAGADARSDWS